MMKRMMNIKKLNIIYISYIYKLNITEYFDIFGLNCPEEVIEVSNRLVFNYLCNTHSVPGFDECIMGILLFI